jgi:hypothetical protein
MTIGHFTAAYSSNPELTFANKELSPTMFSRMKCGEKYCKVAGRAAEEGGRVSIISWISWFSW